MLTINMYPDRRFEMRKMIDVDFGSSRYDELVASWRFYALNK